MKKSILYCIFFILPYAIEAQINIIQYPQDFQVYPRNLITNNTIIPFEFTYKDVQITDSFFLIKYVDNILVSKQLISYQSELNQVYHFLFQDTIQAGLKNYTYELYFNNNFLKRSEQICAGDYYIIYGQSNAVSRMRDVSSADFYNSYIRTFGTISTDKFHNEWRVATGDNVEQSGFIGQLGIVLAHQIVTNNKIPICIINGALGGKPISYFLRNENNKRDLQTAYGRLLSRAIQSGTEKYIRALIWYQGENDAADKTPYNQYREANIKLFKSFFEDFPNLENLYSYQIKQGCNQENEQTSLIQQAQATMLPLFPKEIFISTADIPHGQDLCHFELISGYKKLAERLYPFINFYQYAQPIAENEFCPQAISVESKDSIVTVKISNTQTILANECSKNDFFIKNTHENPYKIETNSNEIKLFFERNRVGDTLMYIGHTGNETCILANEKEKPLICFFKKILKDTTIESNYIGISNSLEPENLVTTNSTPNSIQATLQCIDMTGKTIKNEIIYIEPGKHKYRISQLATGIYKITIQYTFQKKIYQIHLTYLKK